MKTIALIDLNHTTKEALANLIPTFLSQDCEIHFFGNKKAVGGIPLELTTNQAGIHIHGGDKNLPHYSTTLAKGFVDNLLAEKPVRVYVLSSLAAWDILCDKLVAMKSIVVRGQEKNGEFQLKGWKPEILVNHNQVYISVVSARMPPTSYVAHARKNLFAGMSLAIYSTIRAHLAKIVSV